jgi:hypothetical protein
MATIRNRLGKIHMFTRGRDFGVPEYLAEKRIGCKCRIREKWNER